MRNTDDKLITLQDNYMFDCVFKQKYFFKGLFQMILPGLKIEELEKADMEVTILPVPGKHGIRFDVYAEDPDNIFVSELQINKNRFPEKRSRYYQSGIDASALEKGEDYRALKNSYLIVIMLDDLFGFGRMVYRIIKMVEDTDRIFNDGAHTCFINASGKPVPENPTLNEFCHYLLTGEVEEDAFVKEVHEEVLRLNQSKEWREKYENMFNYVLDEVERGREEGREEGEIKALMAHVRKLFGHLTSKGMSKAEAYRETAETFDISVDDVMHVIG